MRKRWLCVITSCICLMTSGCTSSVHDAVSYNQKVIYNMENYMKDRYGCDVDITHTYRTGSGESREYVADIGIDGQSYIITGKYSADGNYSGTSDTVIDTVVRNYETSRIESELANVFNCYRVQVYPSVSVDNNVNFGKIPTFEELLDAGVTDVSDVQVSIIVYCDSGNITQELRGKGEDIAKVVDSEIDTDVSIYFIDNADKVKVEEYISENDIESFLYIINSEEVVNENLDCCKYVLNYGTHNIESIKTADLKNYIVKVDKNKKTS